MEERFLIFLFRSQLGSVFFLWVCKYDIPQEDDAELGKGVDMMKKQTRRLAELYIGKITDPSRFGCKIWGRRPSVPQSPSLPSTLAPLLPQNHDRIEIYFV